MSLTSDRLSEVLQSILPVFDINSLRSEQEMALYVPWVPKATRLLNPAGQTSVNECFAHFGPHARFAGLWPAGFSKRVASGTQGTLYAFLTVNDVFQNLPTGSEKTIIYQLAPLLSSRLEELSPNTGFGKSDAIQIVVSPLISLMFFAHSFHSNVPTRLNSNFKILLYFFQLLPTIVMFQTFLIKF